MAIEQKESLSGSLRYAQFQGSYTAEKADPWQLARSISAVTVLASLQQSTN